VALKLEDFARQAGFEFEHPGLLRRALTHRSYVNEHPEALEDNERLEYLGDAALDFLTAAWLYSRFPEMDEGELTRLRASLVRTDQLARYARELGIGEALQLGRGLDETGGREQPTLLCDAFEAVIGALYLDSGFEAVVSFMEPRLESAVEEILNDDQHLDPRSQLQIWSQAEFGETPRYETVEAHGPDHARRFVVEVSVRNGLKGRGEGRSKQMAARAAAAELLKEIGLFGADAIRR
jgi:ribonuclease-3